MADHPSPTARSFFDAASEELDVQYRAGMEAAILLDRSHLDRVAARGADRAAFLQNMLSADVANLAAGSGTEATFLTNKGKMIASFAVFCEERRVLMEVESERVAPLIEALSRYIVSEDVTLERVDEAAFSVEGPHASRVVAKLTGHRAAELDALAHLSFVCSAGVRVTAHRHDPSPRFDIAAPPSQARELLESARRHGAVVGSTALAETRRLEAGRPRFGVDMDESHLPLEAGLDDAIHFEKGCYIGQEYVVRLAHRGHLNKKLVGIAIEGRDAPDAGTPVMAGDRAAGEITSAAYSPTLDAVVSLGYVRRELFEPGSAVTVDGRPAVVTALPFV